MRSLPRIGIACALSLLSAWGAGCSALSGLDTLSATSCDPECDGGAASDASQNESLGTVEASANDITDRPDHFADAANDRDAFVDSAGDAPGAPEADAAQAGDAAADTVMTGGGAEAGIAFGGECSAGQSVIGVSGEFGTGRMHDVLCGGYSSIYAQSAACHPLYFDGHPGFPNSNPSPWPYDDWDPGLLKTECATNEYVAGIYSATATGRVDGVFCCPGTVTHAACETQLFFGQDSLAFALPDWDLGSFKGQCPSGQYVSGISALIGVGTGPIVTLSFAQQSARYIRVTQTGAVNPYYWMIAEFNVSGPSGTLSRTGWVPSTNSGTDPPANALDGNMATHWSTGVAQRPGQWFQVNLAATQTFTQVTLDTSNTTDYPRGVQVNVSADGVNWGMPVAIGASFAGAPNRILCCSP